MKYEPGEIVFHEGDASRSMYIIKSGVILIQKRTMKGQVEIARLRSGEVLGELSFFDRDPRSATAVAVSDVELVVVDFESLDKIYSTVPSYIKTIVAAVARRLRRANETIKRLQQAGGSSELAEPAHPSDEDPPPPPPDTDESG
jgi:CRP-like cAMP-binding protein